jgi:hypothetical protein
MAAISFEKRIEKTCKLRAPKCARATEQIKSPHLPETFAVAVCKPGQARRKFSSQQI